MKLRLFELHYNLGHVLHQQGDLAGSVLAYREAIRLDGAFAKAHHSLAVVLAEQGQVDAAIWHYHRAIALQPREIKAYNNLGCLLIEQNRSAEAAKLYQQALEIEPNQAVLHSNFGRAIEAQDPAAAVAAYRRAIQLQPNLVSAHYNLGQSLLQKGQHQAAIACLRDLLQVAPDHTGALTACGYAYLAIREFDQAFHYFRTALQFSLPTVEAFCQWAEGLSEDDQLSLARKACSRFLRSLLQPPVNEQAAAISRRYELGQTYQHLGNLLMQYGGNAQLQQAERYYQQAIALQPQNIELSLQLGHCLELQHRWNAATMIYYAALSIQSDAATIHHRLGCLLEQQQRWSEAIAHYRQAMRFVSQNLSSKSHSALLTVASLSFSSSSLNSQRSLSNSDRSAPENNQVRSIYRRTIDWISQHSQGHFVALQPGENQQLTSYPSEISNPESNSISLPIPDQLTDCDGLNCQPCLKTLTKQFLPVLLGQKVYRLSAKGPMAPPPDYFVAHLPNAQAWMTPYQAAWMVTNSITVLSADRNLLADVSREYPGQLPICTRPHSSFQRFLQSSNQSAELIAGRVAVLAGLSGHNYFHWMVDVLPRLELLRRSGLRWSDLDWFWINQVQANFQQETLGYLGIPSDKILAADRHPFIQAETLVVPSFPGHLGWPEPWAIAFLRQQFLPIAAPHPLYERIYVSRNKAHHRRLLNESEVMDRLQALDFQLVELETLSVAEQISLFAHAKVIIAPHGGGLTNLIFCTPGTTVIELFSKNYIRHYYWQVSQQLGLNHYYAVGATFSCTAIHQFMYPSPLMEDIWLDLETLEMALKQAGLG